MRELRESRGAVNTSREAASREKKKNQEEKHFPQTCHATVMPCKLQSDAARLSALVPQFSPNRNAYCRLQVGKKLGKKYNHFLTLLFCTDFSSVARLTSSS